MQSLVSFSVIPKHVTFNGYFTLNSVFAPVWLAPTVLPDTRVSELHDCAIVLVYLYLLLRNCL